ncbi:MAG: hypothetical protein ACREHF_12840 [Rhizomicrobium sp.]
MQIGSSRATVVRSGTTKNRRTIYGTSFGNGGGPGTYGPIALDNYHSKRDRDCAPDPDAIRIIRSNARDLSLQE